MYKITVNGRKPLRDTKEFAEAGELVEFILPAVTDVSTHVTSDKTQVRFDRYEDGRLYYQFIMPDSDVDINVTTESTMVYREPSAPLMGQSHLKHFCSACGTPLAEGQKFCPECGTKRA